MRVAWLILWCAIASSRLAAAGDMPSGEGRLVTRVGGKLVDVPLAHTDVHIRIDGPVAEAEVVQRFINPSTTKIEAVYLFPLPAAAAVDDLAIVSGGRTIRGTIQERAKARRIYEVARGRGLVAALLTQERPNLFTQSVANLEPGVPVEVRIKYVQRLDYDAGGYSVVFPMVVGPRYLPAAWKAKAPQLQAPTLPPGLRSSHDISLAVDLDAGVAIEDLRSSSHQISVAFEPGRSRARIEIRSGDTIPNKDFVLTYRLAGAAPKVGVIGHKESGPGSFLLMVQPPALATPETIAPRELVFVIDTSSSMTGAPLRKAKELIRRMLWTLRPDDTFQIVRFSDASSMLGPGPIAARKRNVDLALRWLAGLGAGGGTEMVTGIETALAVPHDPLRLRILAFITDGYVGNEDDILASVGKHLGASRLFSFGVGTAVNRYLLEEMASLGRGAVQFVRPDEDTTQAVTAFARRLDAPILTDVRVDWRGLAVSDVTPRAIPDLFVGQPLVLSGHYGAGGSGAVTVSGIQGGRPVAFTVPVVLPDAAAHPAIASIWARARVAELSRGLVRKTDPAVEHQILTLALDHHLLTRYTAFVAVDESRVTSGGQARRVVVPVEVPDAARNVRAIGTIGYGAYGTLGMGSGSGSGYGVVTSVQSGYASVQIAAPIVIGDLDKSIIRRYIRRHLAKFRYCYERVLLTRPTLEGTVDARFTIDSTGTVISSTATGVDPQVSACVATAIKTIAFPKADNIGLVQVNYPFKFVSPAPMPFGSRQTQIQELFK